MKYFANCKTIDELKAEYRRLAMANHPDRGGDVETMKQMNADHDAAFEILKKRHNESADEFHQTTETAEEFRDIIAALLKLDGLTVELCGCRTKYGSQVFRGSSEESGFDRLGATA